MFERGSVALVGMVEMVESAGADELGRVNRVEWCGDDRPESVSEESD